MKTVLKIISKFILGAAKKRDVRNLSISPCDQGPPAKAHQLLNGSSSRNKVQSQHLPRKSLIFLLREYELKPEFSL